MAQKRELSLPGSPLEPPVPPVDTRETLIPPEDYIRRLYDQTLAWLTKEVGAEVVARFNKDNVTEWGLRIPQHLLGDDAQGVIDGADVVLPEIPDWDTVEARDASTMGMPLDLEEGVILTDQHNKYALVLGTRHHRHIEPGLGFQAGYVEYGQQPIRADTHLLHLLLNSHANNATVDFSIIRHGPLRIDISGWANSWMNGGTELSDSNDRSIRTGAGFSESMVLVKDTLTRGHRSPTLRQIGSSVVH